MLMRSSSIASCLPAVRDDKDSAAAPRAAEERGLARTCSVPLETEEGWRKRKELQSLRRMAAKRRRSEKKGNLKDDKGDGSSSCVLDLESKIVRENKLNTSRTHTKETTTNPVDEMPYVFTTGGRLNGRRVNGILYKYRREEEEVRIMCICHGKFHSPTEFIKHAGGVDVDHPLRHIVVDWNSSYLF